jgi:NodT family efflux transporter outer membrane factor (OMF) lipoprotein
VALATQGWLALAVAGCTVGPDYQPPEPGAPAAWTEAASPGAAPAGSPADLARWWRGFGDARLDALVDQAIAGNLDLAMADQRIAEARAQRVAAAAGFYPSLTAGARAERVGLKLPPLSGRYDVLAATAETSWEIDVFGRIRRSVEAADASVEASVEDRRAVLVSLLAELGQDYAGLRSAQARLDIARRNIAAETEALDLTREKFRGGLGSELDVAQAEAQLATLKAVLPQLDATVAEEAHAIGVLLGREPGALEAELAEPGALPPAPPVLPASLPSEVVRTRPDIRAAERRLAGSSAEIGVAVAARFPSFTISPFAALAAGGWSALLTSKALQWGIGGSISEPVLDGGRRAADVEAARARAEEARLTWRKTVLTAFQEVEDALVAWRLERQRHDQLAAAAAADRIAVARATSLYRGGLGDFLAVLDGERSLYAAEDALATSDFTLTQETIRLYEALGAGWAA